MSSQSETVDRIRQERESLARHLDELETVVREKPRRWFYDNLPRIVASSFGASLLIGFATANRRIRRY